MLTGQEQPDAGTVTFGESVKLAYVDQSRDSLDPAKTVWEEISDGLDVIKLGDAEMNSRAYCGAFNFKGSDQQKKVGLLSGGERNRVHLAKLLRAGGNVLLLDEPTNDLDVETLRALEDALDSFAGCAVVISPRPLLPRPHLHPHARLRGRRPRRMVRGQLRGLRSRQDPPPRARTRWSRSGSSTRSSRDKAPSCGSGQAGATFSAMTLEELADLIRANSANTNGRIDRDVDHVRDLHGYIDRSHHESNAALMNIQNDLTDVRADIAEVRRNLDLTPVLSTMQRQIDALTAEVAELKRRAS